MAVLIKFIFVAFKSLVNSDPVGDRRCKLIAKLGWEINLPAGRVRR